MLCAYFCRVSATALHCAHAMKARPMHRLGALAGYCPWCGQIWLPVSAAPQIPPTALKEARPVPLARVRIYAPPPSAHAHAVWPILPHHRHMCLLRQSLLCRVSKAFLLFLARLSSHWHTRSRAWS